MRYYKTIRVIIFLCGCLVNACANPNSSEEPKSENKKDVPFSLTYVRQIGKNKLRVYYTGDIKPFFLSFVSVGDDIDSAWTDYAVSESYPLEINGNTALVVTVSPDLMVNDTLIVYAGVPPFTPERACYRYIWPWDDEGPL